MHIEGMAIPLAIVPDELFREFTRRCFREGRAPSKTIVELIEGYVNAPTREQIVATVQEIENDDASNSGQA